MGREKTNTNTYRDKHTYTLKEKKRKGKERKEKKRKGKERKEKKGKEKRRGIKV